MFRLVQFPEVVANRRMHQAIVSLWSGPRMNYPLRKNLPEILNNICDRSLLKESVKNLILASSRIECNRL